MKLKENDYFIFDKPIESSVKQFIKNIYHIPFFIKYRILLNICRPKKIIEKKYKVSICAIFKNEAPYLKEWIEYHRIAGIQHFYLYNNNSDDDYQAVLDPYIKENLVTLIQWPHNQAQMEAYKDGIKRFKDETEWFSFVDIDEFIVPVSSDNIYEILKPFQKNRPVVIGYWKMFGTSGKISRKKDELVTQSFTVAWNKYTDIGKIFYNTAYDLDYSEVHCKTIHHYAWGKFGKTLLPPVNVFDKICIYGQNPIPTKTESAFPLQINHYFTKTYEEYKQKKAKGDVYFKINPHDEEYFYFHEMKSLSQEYKIFKYIIKLKLALGIKE